MATPIEDYAILSNCRTAALVSRDGSIDWLCLPRYDSSSIFGALLGDESHGHWSLRPTDPDAVPTRRYDGDTFVLITTWQTASGVAEVHEFMPVHGGRVEVVRQVIGVSGDVEFTTHVRLRFDYARAIPWIRQVGSEELPAILGIAGPDAVVVRGVQLRAEDHMHAGSFTVRPNELRDLSLNWYPSHLPMPEAVDVDEMKQHTLTWWQDWAARIDHDGPFEADVVRSLLVLRALTHEDTGGIVAAATTSLPEDFGGVRNWDYRYVWLRDAALTIEALISHGFLRVTARWREWLLRAIAGDPGQMQIMYGLAGERDLTEREITSLPGYENSSPVHVGNGAWQQYQADVIGEVMVALEAARSAGLEETPFSWALQRSLLAFVEEHRARPDNGIWEIRGELQMFTQSRAMMWAALDRGVRAVREFGLDGPVERWEALRDEVAAEIDANGFDTEGNYFVQHYGSTEVDASLLLLPQVGYCAYDDPRMLGTVAQMEKTLMHDGLLHRYRTASGVDGLPGAEHPFLACSFWLVEQYANSGRIDEANALMTRLCSLANDVGLLSEEYDVVNQRQVGNTPQALSHLALVRAADALAGHQGRAAQRS
ncbi:GH15 family glucan-1,4-alpha-glucosidase [Microbacterium halimionae]|uniref:GH15 family glucan-1,4-alpha-glucosidase n=2 Tax=Microbacterium halimionae TaxID=1526413 RepID=A0A7W3JQ60_9MICO|nr:GH15 family glucan-1,4-alpha-glucosidase [Microbacterium halimionae]NII94523.1 GH15 family glucan-1,4-alpha-glucosidase [Microbacterium halimionae]